MSSVIDRDQMDPHSSNQDAAGQANLRHKFTPDELRVLRECNREAFYYRCIPVGTALTVSTYFAIKNGYLKPSPRWGPSPKMFAASVLGYFIGKFSYQSACVDKLMQVPNSQLAEQLRQRRGLPSLGDWTGGSGGDSSATFPSPFPLGPETATDYSSASQNVFTDVGDTRPLDSFDTSAPPSRNDLVIEEDIPLQPATKSTTYDELRRANRDEFYKGRTSAPAPSPQPQPPTRDPRPGTGPAGGGSKNVVKNKYGDEWERTD